jgi:hypothetical protein
LQRWTLSNSFASVEDSGATQLVIECNSGASGGRTRWSVGEISGRSNRGGPRDDNAFSSVAGASDIARHMSGPNRQICTQRFRINRSSCERLIRWSGSGVGSTELSRRQRGHRAVKGWINSL